MNNDEFQIITKKDLETLNLSPYIKKIIFQDLNIENLDLNQLVKIIDKLIFLINKEEDEEKKHGVMMRTSSNSYSYSYQNLRKKNFQQIMLLSGFLEFRIRQFLLKETIYYSLGATDEHRQLFERRISQDELWSQISKKNELLIRSSLSSKSIQISKTLENINKNRNSFAKVGAINLWPELLKLAFVDRNNIYDGNSSSGDDDSEKYNRFGDDHNVYFSYKEGKKQLKSYYYKKQGEYLFYNQGWLYEWYLTYINKSKLNEQSLAESIIYKKSFYPMVYGMDSNEGIKSGDFADIQKHQVQAKFHNQQIISFHNILEVLLSLQQDLKLLQKNPSDISSIVEKIESIFVSEELAKKVNSDYNITIKKQLELLSKGLQNK